MVTCAFTCRDLPLAFAAGITVEYRRLLKHWFADVHERVVRHPLGKSRRMNPAFLGIENPEPPVITEAETSLRQTAGQPGNILLQPLSETAGRRTRPFALGRLPSGQPEFSGVAIFAIKSPARPVTIAASCSLVNTEYAGTPSFSATALRKLLWLTSGQAESVADVGAVGPVAAEGAARAERVIVPAAATDDAGAVGPSSRSPGIHL